MDADELVPRCLSYDSVEVRSGLGDLQNGLKIVRWGNSLAVRFPAWYVRKNDLKVGDWLTLDPETQRFYKVRPDN